MESLGTRLREARARQVISQDELSDRSGVTKATISRLENNKTTRAPNRATVRKLADALDVDAGWLLTGSTVDLPKVLAA